MTKFRKLGKRGLALFVALVLLVGMVPLSASAALISGEKFTVNVVKVVNGSMVDEVALTTKCLQRTGHSGYNHSTNLQTLAKNSGFSGYKGYNWSTWTTVPSTYKSGLAPDNNYAPVHYNITGSAPYKANETLFLFFENSKIFTLNYNANGGFSAPARQTATAAATSYKFTVSTTQPTRSGYTFLGWSTNPHAVLPSYYGGGSIDVTETTTLHAVWQKQSQPTTVNYTVEWYDVEGKELKGPETRSAMVDTTVAVTNEDKVIAGYTFDTTNQGNILSTLLGADSTKNVLRLYFTKDEEPTTVKVPVTVKVRFEGLEGVFDVCTHPKDFNLTGATSNPDAAVGSFYVRNDHGDGKEDDGTPFVTFAETHGFAPWTVELGKPYTVQFTEDYYTVDGYTCVSIDEKTGADKNVVTKTVTFTKDNVENGYEFVITNVYEKIAEPDPEYTYTLTYDANAGTDTVEDMPAPESHTSAETSHTFTLSTETPTRTGWVFKGWSTTSNGSTGVTSVTATSTEPNVTVYAIWEESTPIDPDPETATITLIYDANGGTGSMDADSQEVAMGASATFTVKENAFTHQGYTFTGWNTEADGSGETVAADSIFTTAVDATLYAQWESTDPDPTDPGPGPVDPPTPPTPIVTPEPVATPTPSAEPTAEPTDDPGVDIPDPTQPPLGPGPSDDPGTDIPDEEPPMGDNPILNLVDHYHYLVGYPDGSIRPGANITRAEVAEVFYRLMTADARVANWATGNSYSDVIDTAWYTDAINVMSKAGIVNGYEDGTARPNRAITRAEFAMIASQFLADYVEDPGTTTFTDIQGHWAESAIRKVQSIGWVNGDAGTTNFRPNDKITRAEAAVIFNNMLERTPDAEHLDGAMKVWPDNDPGAWYYAAMQEATNSHYYTGNEGTANEEWAEVFEHDWVALKAYWKANAGQSPEE